MDVLLMLCLCLHYSLLIYPRVQLEYAYLFWARYFVPTRFHNGEPMLKRIGEPGYAPILEISMLGVHLDFICALQYE